MIAEIIERSVEDIWIPNNNFHSTNSYLGAASYLPKKNINMGLAKVWTAMDRLSIIWKSDLSDKKKNQFFSKQWLCQFYDMEAPH